MRDPLLTYLKDHLAGAKFAVDLLAVVRDTHPNRDLGRFASEMLHEVDEDRDVLRDLIAKMDSGRSASAKEVLGWAGGVLARMKFRHRIARKPGTLETLEVVSLGVLGKRALWTALSQASTADPNLHDVDYEHLAQRAESQYTRIEERRLDAARTDLIGLDVAP